MTDNPRIPRSNAGRRYARMLRDHTEAMQEAIAASALLPGDIVATANATPSSSLIQTAISGPFSHAILYRGSGYVVDAVPGDGVTRGLLDRKIRGSSATAVFRHRTASREQRELAAKWAVKQAGKPYDYGSAAGLVLGNGSRRPAGRFARSAPLRVLEDEAAKAAEDASFFCSELIYRAFEVAGAPLVEAPSRTISPTRLLTTRALEHLGRLRDVG